MTKVTADQRAVAKAAKKAAKEDSLKEPTIDPPILDDVYSDLGLDPAKHLKGKDGEKRIMYSRLNQDQKRSYIKYCKGVEEHAAWKTACGPKTTLIMLDRVGKVLYENNVEKPIALAYKPRADSEVGRDGLGDGTGGQRLKKGLAGDGLVRAIRNNHNHALDMCIRALKLVPMFRDELSGDEKQTVAQELVDLLGRKFIKTLIKHSCYSKGISLLDGKRKGFVKEYQVFDHSAESYNAEFSLPADHIADQHSSAALMNQTSSIIPANGVDSVTPQDQASTATSSPPKRSRDSDEDGDHDDANERRVRPKLEEEKTDDTSSENIADGGQPDIASAATND